ncbi:MAG: Radial spoke head protein 4 A, partial [Marteilia pararefringens]
MGTAYESEYDYDSFKAYMQRDYAMKTEEQSNNIVTNVSIYEVLTKIVSHLERYRPDDPMDFIEKEFINIKRKIKHDKAHLRNDLMEMKEEQKIFDESGINNLCENLKRNLKKFENLSNDSSASTENYNGFQDENFSWKIYDLIEDMHNFRRVGVGISEAESAKVWISMRILAEKYGHFTKSVRFWGKIYGTIKNYYILELDKEIVEGSEEPEDDNIDLEDINKENNEAILDPSDSSSNNIANSKAQKVKSKVKVPKEINSGTNKFIYFFSNDPSLNDWRKLPDV